MDTSHASKRPRTDADADADAAAAAPEDKPLFILQVIDCNPNPGDVCVNMFIKMPYKYGHTMDAQKYDEECFAAFARHMLRRCELDERVHGKGRDFMLADVDEEGTEGAAVTVTDADFELPDGDQDNSTEELAKMLRKKGLDDDVETFLKTMWQDMLNKATEDKLATVNFDYARMSYGHLPWVQVFWSVQ